MSINLARVFTPHGNIVYTANDFRQTLRIVFAGMIALSISSFYNTSYGVFLWFIPSCCCRWCRCLTATWRSSLSSVRR
jgi:type IV secretory pathway TrbD component